MRARLHRALVAAAVLYAALPLDAAGLKCAIRPPNGTPTSALPALAKLGQADAARAAAGATRTAPADVGKGQLEVKQGCLVYSFNVRAEGRPGAQNLIVDAGTGKILSRSELSPKDEERERVNNPS
jgi:hypothetical protein